MPVSLSACKETSFKHPPFHSIISSIPGNAPFGASPLSSVVYLLRYQSNSTSVCTAIPFSEHKPLMRNPLLSACTARFA